MKPDPLDFLKKYDLISASKTFAPTKSKANICRYCSRTSGETTFKQKTHLLPELLGENNSQTFDECDICNNLFSKYESNLAIFIRPYITLLGVKGKNKVPKFQSRSIDGKEETRTYLTHRDKGHKELIIQDVDDYILDTENKSMQILFRKPQFTPNYVYKALLKIGLSLLPTELDNYNTESFCWLTNRPSNIDYIQYAFSTTLKRSYFEKPSACLYQAKKLHTDKQEFPEHVLLLSFANQIFQIFLPFSKEFKKMHDPKRTLEINLFPACAFDKVMGKQTFTILGHDLSNINAISQDHIISFSYQDAVINSSRK